MPSTPLPTGGNDFHTGICRQSFLQPPCVREKLLKHSRPPGASPSTPSRTGETNRVWLRQPISTFNPHTYGGNRIVHVRHAGQYLQPPCLRGKPNCARATRRAVPSTPMPTGETVTIPGDPPLITFNPRAYGGSDSVFPLRPPRFPSTPVRTGGNGGQYGVRVGRDL